jgi:hypothetical protein
MGSLTEKIKSFFSFNEASGVDYFDDIGTDELINIGNFIGSLDGYMPSNMPPETKQKIGLGFKVLMEEKVKKGEVTPFAPSKVEMSSIYSYDKAGEPQFLYYRFKELEATMLESVNNADSGLLPTMEIAMLDALADTRLKEVSPSEADMVALNSSASQGSNPAIKPSL